MSQGQLLFAGAALGAASAIVVGWFANWARAATETKQWERQRLHEAYENFLAAHEHMLSLFIGRNPGTTQTDLDLGWRDVNERAARMRLLAPAEIVTAAEHLIKALQVFYVDSQAYATMTLATKKDPDKWDDGMEQTYGEAFQKHTEAKAAFIESARADLLHRRQSWMQRSRSWMASEIAHVQPTVESLLPPFRRTPKQ